MPEQRKPGRPVIPEATRVRVDGAVFAVLAGPVVVVTARKGTRRG